MQSRFPVAFAVLALIIAVSGMARAESKGAPEAAEFFEREIRPVLADHCQACHGPKEAKGGLRLTSRRDLLKGGKSGPAIEIGKPAASLLLKALDYTGAVKMPPSGKLPSAQIAKMRQWLAMGAPWPESKVAAAPAGEWRPTEAQRQWWAYQPLRPKSPPQVEGAPHASGIDRFLLAEMAKHRLTPAKPADRRTLIRRVSFDLTGLPPTPKEVADFLNDRAPDAWAKVVDRLLASPQYGERMARRWLDVVRYADYHDGNPKARDPICEPLEAWRYRDWVVRSFNQDLPYNDFITHQVAGDLLPKPEGKEFYEDGLVATTFLTNGSWDRGDADKEKMVSDMVDDQIDTVGKAFMGLTLGCARCHNHKFDPVSNKDYYALAGIFYSTRILKDLGAKGANYILLRTPLATAEYVKRYEEQGQAIAAVNARIAELDKQSPRDDATRSRLINERTELQSKRLAPPPLAEAAQDDGTPGTLFPRIGDVPVHIRGSYTRLGETVPRRMPEFFASGPQAPIAQGSGRRELAAFLTSPKNALTARVIVNRVWQWYFGTGMVKTPNNFGLLSEPPSHPALLDWLAGRFARPRSRVPGPGEAAANSSGVQASGGGFGWSIKALQREILLSESYRRSSVAPRSEVGKDPENRWLARHSARRLEAEELRDAMLSVSGKLDLKQGGPASDDVNIARRSLYVQTARWDRSSFAMLFDAANPDASVEKRTVSTVAPQALGLLNTDFALSLARGLAERLAKETHPDNPSRIRRAYELLFSRPPTAQELTIAGRVLNRPDAREEVSVWSDLAHVLLLTDEFAYVD